MDSDLISRDALIRDMYEDGYFPLTAADKATEKVMTQPTVDAVEVVHGEWRLDLYTAKYGNPYRCSECKEEYGDKYNYCPNCGAKMDGGVKE